MERSSQPMTQSLPPPSVVELGSQLFLGLLLPSWIFLKSLVCDWGDSSSTEANQLHILAVAIFKDDNLVSKYSFAFGIFFCWMVPLKAMVGQLKQPSPVFGLVIINSLRTFYPTQLLICYYALQSRATAGNLQPQLLPPSVSSTFHIFHDGPGSTPSSCPWHFFWFPGSDNFFIGFWSLPPLFLSVLPIQIQLFYFMINYPISQNQNQWKSIRYLLSSINQGQEAQVRLLVEK